MLDLPMTSWRGVTIRPVHADDWAELRMAEFAMLGPAWRSRGATYSSREYESVVSAGVTAQTLAFFEGVDGLVLAAWYQLYGVELENQIGFVSAAKFPTANDEFAIGAALFVEHVFGAWPLRKVYFEIPAYNEGAFITELGGLLHEEARIKERVFSHGAFHDVGVYSLARETWDQSSVSEAMRRFDAATT